jgi:hypothetical protein
VARRRSFTVAREPVELVLGGDEFRAPPVIPPAVLGEMLEAGERIEEVQKTQGLSHKDQLDQMMKILDEVFGLILVPESAAVFHERLYSRTNPLDLQREVMPALEWLIEEFTDRPTQPSPPSTNGQGDGASSSTSGAPAEASTPTRSQPTAGATPSTPPSTT